MTFHVSVTYPNDDDTTFDMQYYLDTHMPLVDRGWKPEGLLKWDIVQFAPGPDGSQPHYRVAAHLAFRDEASFAAAAKCAAAAGIFGDVANFTNKSPTLALGKVVASG